MLAGLRHQAFIRSDHQHHQINAVRSGQHVFDKAFVTGNIYKSEVRIADRQISKANINRDAALFFFLEAIRIYAGKGAHKGGFTVINVSGSTNNYSFHGNQGLFFSAAGKVCKWAVAVRWNSPAR